MTNTRELILRLRHDSPTRDLSLEAADMIELLSRAQRRLPHSDTIIIGSVVMEGGGLARVDDLEQLP